MPKKILNGVVVSDKPNKTITVMVERKYSHPVLKKVIKARKKYNVHDENNRFKQVRFSPRLDFVPLMEKEKLELYYSARNKISEMYNSEKFRIEFKLKPGDLLMMDNHRLLHGRTEYNANEGNRFLQGCYIDYDSTEGKLKHLKRKFDV